MDSWSVGRGTTGFVLCRLIDGGGIDVHSEEATRMGINSMMKE